jgi:hypothetical protein
MWPPILLQVANVATGRLRGLCTCFRVRPALCTFCPIPRHIALVSLARLALAHVLRLGLQVLLDIDAEVASGSYVDATGNPQARCTSCLVHLSCQDVPS